MTCETCAYNINNFCTDKETFVDKNDIKNIVCRYSKHAIRFNSYRYQIIYKKLTRGVK